MTNSPITLLHVTSIWPDWFQICTFFILPCWCWSVIHKTKLYFRTDGLVDKTWCPLVWNVSQTLCMQVPHILLLVSIWFFFGPCPSNIPSPPLYFFSIFTTNWLFLALQNYLLNGQTSFVYHLSMARFKLAQKYTNLESLGTKYCTNCFWNKVPWGTARPARSSDRTEGYVTLEPNTNSHDKGDTWPRCLLFRVEWPWPATTPPQPPATPTVNGSSRQQHIMNVFVFSVYGTKRPLCISH